MLLVKCPCKGLRRTITRCSRGSHPRGARSTHECMKSHLCQASGISASSWDTLLPLATNLRRLANEMKGPVFFILAVRVNGPGLVEVVLVHDVKQHVVHMQVLGIRQIRGAGEKELKRVGVCCPGACFHARLVSDFAQMH